MTSISIDVCSGDQLESLSPLFEAYRAKPYFYLKEIDRAHLNRLFCQKIHASCQESLGASLCGLHSWGGPRVRPLSEASVG